MAQAPNFTTSKLGQPQAQTVGLPDVPSDVSPTLKTFLQGVKEILETREGQRGSGMQRSVLMGDLVSAGLYDAKAGSFNTGGDTTPPGPPRNLAAFQRGSYNLLTWTNPADADLDFVEIWSAEDSTSIKDAKLRGVIKAPGEVFEHSAIKLTVGYNYWARAADTSMNYSGWTTTVVHTDPGIDTAGGDIYDIFFGDLTKNPGVIRIRSAIQATGAYYYEDQSYYVDDVVIYGGYVYQSIKDNPSPSKGPEDTAYWKRYDSLADISVKNEVRITQSEDQILLRATKAEVKENIDNVNSVMTSALAVQAEQIAARVTKTDFYPTQQLAKDNAAQLVVQANQITSKVSQTNFDLLNGKVATVSSEVDQMADSWTVKIQGLNNGQKAVTGIDLALNDGRGQSQFIVMADNFRVVSSTYGTPVGLFAVSGNGVYINNTLYAPGGIQTSNIAAQAITADKIAAGTITATQLAANSITTEKIAANAITANNIAAGSITADKIAAGAITANSITTGTLDANLIRENGIPLSKIASGVVASVSTGSMTCFLGGGSTHIFIATITVWGRGSLSFDSTIGSQQFPIGSFYGRGNEDAYPSLGFSTTKAGGSSSSYASWNVSGGLNVVAASIIGIAIK